MLTQLVRPMVRTQLQLLASCQTPRSTLTSTICQWLGIVGMQAQVDQVDAHAEYIRVSVTVGKPDGCNTGDWQQILQNLKQDSEAETAKIIASEQTAHQQQHTLARLLAYLLQVGDPNIQANWSQVRPKLQALNMDEQVLAGIQSALKIPQSLEQVVKHLDADVAAIALPQAVSIALMDRQVNESEDQVLSALFQLIKQ